MWFYHSDSWWAHLGCWSKNATSSYPKPHRANEYVPKYLTFAYKPTFFDHFYRNIFLRWYLSRSRIPYKRYFRQSMESPCRHDSQVVYDKVQGCLCLWFQSYKCSWVWAHNLCVSPLLFRMAHLTGSLARCSFLQQAWTWWQHIWIYLFCITGLQHDHHDHSHRPCKPRWDLTESIKPGAVSLKFGRPSDPSPDLWLYSLCPRRSHDFQDTVIFDELYFLRSQWNHDARNSRKWTHSDLHLTRISVLIELHIWGIDCNMLSHDRSSEVFDEWLYLSGWKLG